LIPGDPERIIAAERIQSGIPVHDEVDEDLRQIALQLGIAPL
jgi:LDH2 family malate/lactate/ureidoglycolate dehydrogenase